MVPVEMGLPELLMMRLLSRFGDMTGVSVVVECIEAFLEATFVQICLSNVGGGGAGRWRSPGIRMGLAGGAGGALPDWEVLNVSSSVTLLMRVSSLFTRAGPLW